MGPFGPELLSTKTQVFSRRARSAAVATLEWSSGRDPHPVVHSFEFLSQNTKI